MPRSWRRGWRWVAWPLLKVRVAPGAASGPRLRAPRHYRNHREDAMRRDRRGPERCARRRSGDLDDAWLDRLEPVSDQRVVAGDDQLLGARERVDRLEGGEHLGQARDDLHGLARLHIAVEVGGV